MIKRFYILLLAIVASVGMSWAATTDLASITDNYTAQDGEILTGTLGVNVKISIADGATVTLLNANINGDKTWTTGDYAGLTCLGDATITIVGKNSVSGFSTENGYPGIYVPSGKTLIIKGTGSLTAESSTQEAAGIGAGRTTHCGNIEIQSGKITAIAGGEEGAGIGGAFNADCGNITISGGIVTAVGGDYSAGIGGGKRSGKTDAGHCGNILISGGVVSATSGKQAAAIGGGRGNNVNYLSNCGTITITNTALKVYAEQGGDKGSTNTIGAGKYNNCGTVTIGGNTGVINNDPYTYRTKEDGEIVVDYINAIGTVVYTQECKDKIDIARELYDALEDSQKTLVTNYQTLLDAEAAYAALIPAAPANACGDGVIWELNNGALTISYTGTGTGVMDNYASRSDAPWYSHSDDITSVTITDGVKSVGSYSFGYYENLVTVTIGNDVETIGEYAFGDCYKFTTLNLGNSIKHIGDRAFMWAKVLTGFTLPSTLETIGDRAFLQNKKITSLTIPSNVTSIGLSAFFYCAALTSITVEATTPPTLGATVFDGVPTSIPLNVPNGSVAAYTAAAQWNAFDIQGYDPAPATPANVCGDGLTWELSEGVLTISYDGEGTGEMYDFGYEYDENPVNVAPWKENKSDITTVVIGDGVKSIGNYAFNDLGENFTAVTIANSVERIGLSAFMNAKWVTEITLPSSLKTIDRECFAANFGFTSITIPSGVTSIGYHAFGYCTALTSLTCEATTPPTLASGVFYKITSKTSDMSNIPLYVPSESVAAYQDANQWNAFNVQAIPGGGSTDVIPCTAADLGKVLCTDGSIYATVSEATAASKTAAAVIAYVDTENGKALALALADDGGEMEWGPAKTTAAAHTPAVSNGTWKLASKDDWNNMITAAGGYEALRDCFSGVGGTNMQQDAYWSSTPVDDLAWIFYFAYGGKWVDDHVDNPCYVRACLAFDIPAAPANKLYMEVDGTAGTLKWGLAGSNPVYDGDAIQYSDRKYITTLTIDESCQNHTLTSFYNLFHIFKALTTINGIENLATANVENMSYMFYDCQSLTSLDLSSFNTAKVTNMKGMFNGCSNLTTIYVGDDWNTSAVTNGGAMFYGCTNLPNYDSGATGVAKAYVGAGGYLSAKLTPADVVALISAIGEVEYTAECKAKIDAARAAYNGLSDEDKALVTNYSTLQQAETDYANAKQAADQTAADPVIAKINEIPSPMTAENTKLSVYPKVQDARAAYDALTADQKALVSNYSRLTDAEDAFAAIGGGGLPTGALTGAFSVGESSAICFSQGNLQATTADLGANWTWSFAANQWDFIGNAVANTAISDIKSVSTNGTVDLFGWSTAATYYGISNNPGAAYYTGDFIDWGTNAISNGGNTANAWHTLAHDEWDYLFNTRTTTSGIRYAKATVNGIPGIILLPDDWSATYYALSNTNDYEVDFNSNVITTSDWTNLLEANGVVFLPAAGERLGADVNEVGSIGHYWSSTFKTEYNSYCLSFKSYNVDASDYINRREGYSVRLVVAAPVNYIAEAQAALALINAIPDPVTLDEACVKAIKDARAAVTALGENASLIDETDMAKLTKAETDYAALAAAAAAPVIAQIEALPTAIKLSTYYSTYDLMVAARAAYNALSAEVQAAVTNLSKLTNLEAAFAAIGGVNEKLSKPFSVGEGQVVYFSHGNLQATYNGTNWSWAFAAHQYDYIGDTSGNIIINGNGTLSGAGTVDLFGWVANSSTVLTSGVAKYGVSNSDNVSDYGLGTTETLKGDWGVAANDANIGGYNDWRILSKDEWVYLFKTRTDAASKYGYATVGGVNGVIIIPNAFTDPMKNKGNKAFIPQNVDKGYSTNVYATGGDWEAMEAAGAVFMPAAGRRYGTTMTVNEGTGFYWSSTPMSYQASYFMGFMGSNVVPDNDRYRSHGLSVRLVSNNAPVASTPLDSALVVKDLIEAIPAEITLDAACVKAINDAREAYNKLSEAAKGLLDEATIAKLTDAEADLTALYQVEADKVIAKINNIPSPVTLKLATRDSIESARAAFEALNADQKALVSNYDVLTAAEAALAALNPGGGAPLPEGALTGAFSINADGDKIAFSKGNLQATTANLGETWTWAFAANQYDYVGNAVANTAITGNKTVSTNGTIDLFGWSTAATYYGINNSNVSGKHPGDFIDWGETIAEGWRTLTRDEWNYLLETRTDAASKYGHATVAGIHGIIVLPDSYKGTAINADHSDWSNNIISAEDWAAYEANGVAFLPAAGSRLTTNVNYVGEYALYWTSTTYGEKWAYRVRFLPNLSPDYGDRVPGHSVRLVTAHTGGVTPLDSAQAVKDLIEAIPMPVTLEDACVNAVQAARDAYNALSDAAKGALDDATVQKLNQAITDYTALIQAGADEVIAKINNIPQPVTLKLATRDSIESARAAYDALTADQQALVTNYPVLTAAEAALAALNPGGGMPAGALNGKFTINAGGDQIAFAKGNLQATTTDLGEHWTWGFAANQWNYLGIVVANSKINGNGTVSENGTVDLFGWSTAATYYGINNSYKAVDYIGDFVDWGPNMGAGWRTLTKDEWNYLIENNTKGRATVNDKNGYIFLPNDWSGPAFTPDPDNFTTNVYSGDDWTAMENAGAVFLPSGPARNGTYALIANDAKYSSSTSLNNDTSCVFTIYYNQSQSACTGTNRAYGCMVRLVSEGGGATPLDSAQAVKDLIEAIPMPVTLEDACVNAVQAARDAYNALSDAAKGALDDATVQKLNQAIADYTALIQAGADAVKDKIAAIPQPVTLKLATRDSIQNARAAYDALTADQKALVSNYDVLTAAEATWAGLVNVAPAGALSGKYTINAGGDVIYFAHGNLQYTRENLDADWSTGTFRLATNQYDLIEADKTYPAAYCTDNYGDKTAVGLFGWGTWGEGKTPNLTSSDRTLYTWSTDFSGALEGTDTWRTLTKDEWVYLLAHNNQSYATVHGVNGLLVAPDGKDIDGKSMADWVVINDETWTTMQNDGYLFLPACGQRSQMSATANITTGSQGEEVLYYSSTEYSDVYAYNIWYKPGQDPAAADYSNKRQAFGIRLVSAGINPLDQVQVVKGLIDAIPVPVTLDDACVNAIQAARDAYDALSEDAKAILDAADVKKLTDAEATLTALNQAVADEVIAKINNIPQPVELKLATRDSIESARTAYDALNAAQQALVSNYQTLLDAEATMATLNPGGSVPVEIVWDKNTGIESVNPGVTSPAYEGVTVTVGSGSAFSVNPEGRFNFTFYAQPNGGFTFANADGSNITKVVIESATALTSTMTEVERMGSGWAISNDNTTATWTGDADSVSIWKGQSFTNYWYVDVITFTVNGVGATPLDSAQHVKDLIDAIPTPVEYPTSGPAIAAALVAYQQLSDAAKGALDDADVQKLTDAAAQYAALDAIAAIEAIPAEIVYDPAVKAAIETAREKYDALIDASKALVDAEVVAKLTNAEQAWAILVAKIEHNVSYIGKDGELKTETVALFHIPDPAPDFNGYEFVRWDVKAGDFLEEGLRIKAVYSPIITTNPQGFDTLAYNGAAQELIAAGVAKEGHIEYSLYPEEPESWSANLPTATNAGVYAIYYKLVREGHADYLAPEPTMATIAKVPVTYVAPTAVDSLVYNAQWQTLIKAGQTNDGTFEYSLSSDNWMADLPMAKDVDTINVYFRVLADANHLDSIAPDPVRAIIHKAELTATADDKFVIYEDNVPEYTVTYAGWLGEDTITALTGEIAFECAYTDTTGVGEYAIIPSGVDAANYAINFVNGKLTVGKAESSCFAPEAYDTLVYNGIAQTLIMAALPVGGEMYYTLDTANVGSWSLDLPQAKDVATYNVFYRVKGDRNHFDKDYDQPVAVSIAKAALTITPNDKTVTYGDSVPQYDAYCTGLMGTDTDSVVSGLTYSCDYAPTSNVGEYAITLSGATAANYDISYADGKVTVQKAALMITAEDKNVIYGDAAPAYTAAYSGWKNSDDAAVLDSLIFHCEYAVTSNVGEYAIVPDSAVAMNYRISYTAGKITVAQAALTITANDTAMIYGDAAPEFTATYSGWKNSDNAAVVSGLKFTTPYQPGSHIGEYEIVPSNATAQNYAISFANGKLTVGKADVRVSGAEVHTAKFADGHAVAEVTKQGTLEGIKLNDAIAHITTAAFSSADVAEHLTITLFYELTGNADLLKNYNLTPVSEVFTTEGVIIEPMTPNEEHQPGQEEQVEVQEGIDIKLYGYCDGDTVGMRYHLNSGNPDEYKIDFEDSRFNDVDWTKMDSTGKGRDGFIYISIPVDVPTGDYNMTVYFRDSRFDWLESQAFKATFHVNLPETYVRPLFDNTIVLVDTCECFTDIQWYYRKDASEPWQIIEGATGHYYHADGKLEGEYFVKAKMNGVETYTCEQTDMQTLYGAGDKKQAIVRAYPNPVVNTTTVSIEYNGSFPEGDKNSDNYEHLLRIVNLMGVELQKTTFEGNETVVDMDGYVTGNYTISVDGIVVKVLKK